MTVENLPKIFRPQSIAVVGASSGEDSVGHTVLKNLLESEFVGTIYPVHPHHAAIEGLEAYSEISELPEVPDLAIVATPAQTVPEVVRQCGEHGILGLIVLSAGFREVGTEGRVTEQKLLEQMARFPGMRVLGPNCLGVLVPHAKLNASFAASMPNPGRIAFISQSGALCSSILDWSLAENIGFSYFVSIGNALNVKVGDLIDFLAEDPHTDAIVLYVESVAETRRFMSAARAFTRTKPIVVYKAGHHRQSARAVASHTGALTGEDDVYEAAFRRAGMVRVYDAADMFDCAELLARHRKPEGPNLAIVTNAGGPGVMALDSLLDSGGELAELTVDTLNALDALLPPHWSHGNPVDLLGDALPERFQQAVDIVAVDKNVDALLVILTPQAMTNPTQTAELIAESAKKTHKPILAVWMGGGSVTPGRDLLNQSGIATYDSPDRAVRAFSYLVSNRRNREILYETPRQVLRDSHSKRQRTRQQLQTYLSEGRSALTEIESKALLAQYGILSTTPQAAKTSLDAIRIARDIGFPVVMKINSPDILHKTEVRGVATGITDPDHVKRVYSSMIARARLLRPEARLDGVTIQPMISAAEGIELIIGAKRDPVFGAVVMIGAGGVTAEILRDRALELPPLNERLARRMLEQLKIRPLLEGYRGHRPVHTKRLIEVMLRVSDLIVDHPEILELDVNPLLATPDGVTALDASVILDTEATSNQTKPFAHLAICPYPDKYVRQVTLRDGANVLLRPIQPEDEPMWHALVARCSERSLWLRFRYVFKKTTHEMATRFCFIDYDRTMAIVAEVGSGDDKQLVGVGRLLADADHQEAEYAVIVDDQWQSRGLGTLLTDYCLKICRDWGIDRVLLETTTDNQGMQSLATRYGFVQKPLGDTTELLFEKQLSADDFSEGEFQSQVDGPAS